MEGRLAKERMPAQPSCYSSGDCVTLGDATGCHWCTAQLRHVIPMMCSQCRCADADFVRGLYQESHFLGNTRAEVMNAVHSQQEYIPRISFKCFSWRLNFRLAAASSFTICGMQQHMVCCLVASHDRDSSPKAIPCWSTDACLARCFGSVRFATATTGRQSPSDIRSVSSPAKQAPCVKR